MAISDGTLSKKLFCQIEGLNHAVKGFASTFADILLFRHAYQRPKGAGADAGWFHSVFDSHITAVALHHFAVLSIAERPERARHPATSATYAAVIVIDRHSCFIVFGQTANRTGYDTRGVVAMHAGGGKIDVTQLVFLFPFYVECVAQRFLARDDINVVLIYARYAARVARATFLGIKNNQALHAGHLRFPDIASGCFIPRESGIRIQMIVANDGANICF